MQKIQIFQKLDQNMKLFTSTAWHIIVCVNISIKYLIFVNKMNNCCFIEIYHLDIHLYVII